MRYWRLMKVGQTNYGSNITPSRETMLNTTHGFINNFQGRDNYVGGNDAKS